MKNFFILNDLVMNSFSFVSDGWQIKKESRTIPLNKESFQHKIENLLNQWKKNYEVLLQPFTVNPKKISF